MTSIAVVEDEDALLRTICRFLTKVGYVVDGFADAETFMAAHQATAFDIAVLDVNLPGMDGFETAARVRDMSPSVGIIILTARADVDDRVTGLLNGADNYLTKPLHLTELHVVIQNLARRMAMAPGAAPEAAKTAQPQAVEPVAPASAVKVWRLDEMDWRLVTPLGSAVSLTASEFRILRTLMRASDLQADRETLMETLGKKPEHESDRRIDNLLSLLRRKVREETGQTLPVKSIRSSGYAFTGPVEGRAAP